MRSQEAIADRMRAIVAQDNSLERETPILLPCLDYLHAREWLSRATTANEWESARRADGAEGDDALREDARIYVEKVWVEIAQHRRITADRAVDSLRSYVWLLGTDIEANVYDTLPVDPFAAPRVAFAANMLGLPIPTDAGTQRMIKGKPCSDLCISGCRSAQGSGRP